MKKFKQRGTCQKCGKTCAYQLQYAKWNVGWFCPDHRPDQAGAIQVDELMGYFKLDGQELEIYPQSWQQPGHPFKNRAEERIEAGLGKWAPTVMTLVPRLQDHQNRAQRRAKR